MKRAVVSLALVAIVAFIGWRFVRPFNIFVVSEAFERPVSTVGLPDTIGGLSAEECGACHQAFYDEWATTIHARAWTDPYFQVDFRFDGSQQICKNCHIPLDRQQEHLVTGFRDAEKWDPVLVPNPDFDPELQSQGVTCSACHLRQGRILGPYGSDEAPHPVAMVADPNQICVRCHVVGGERWDTFFRFPPCGTVAEITTTRGDGSEPARASLASGASGEVVVAETAALGCIECHMPAVERPLLEGGEPRATRRHVWRGGHDPDMVRRALAMELRELLPAAAGERKFSFTISNVGAAHYVPTGTPDRQLVVSLRLLDGGGGVLAEKSHSLKRTIMWRPFIVDLWDTRLPRGQPRTYDIEFATGEDPAPAVLEAVVRYVLVGEKRLRRIGYEDGAKMSYEIYRERVALTAAPLPR